MEGQVNLLNDKCVQGQSVWNQSVLAQSCLVFTLYCIKGYAKEIGLMKRRDSKRERDRMKNIQRQSD